jgi:hypothetical protein
MLLYESVPHGLSLAKKATAFFKISRSISTFFNAHSKARIRSDSPACSGFVSTPWAFFTHVSSNETAIPSFLATSVRFSRCSNTIRAASALNSSECARYMRFSDTVNLPVALYHLFPGVHFSEEGHHPLSGPKGTRCVREGLAWVMERLRRDSLSLNFRLRLRFGFGGTPGSFGIIGPSVFGP